jgi:hypothetical protein
MLIILKAGETYKSVVSFFMLEFWFESVLTSNSLFHLFIQVRNEANEKLCQEFCGILRKNKIRIYLLAKVSTFYSLNDFSANVAFTIC